MKKSVVLLSVILLLIFENYSLAINISWEKTLGKEDYNEYIYSVTQTENGNFIAVGYSELKENNRTKIFLIKFDKNGREIWKKGYKEGYNGRAKSIAQTNDGCFLVGGDSTEGNLIKIDKSGNIIWRKSLKNNGDWIYINSVNRTKGNHYIIAGAIHEHDALDYQIHLYIVKCDQNYNWIWGKRLGKERRNDEIYSVIETEEGDIAIAGSTASFGNGSRDGLILILDEKGKNLWSKTYGGNNWDEANSIIQTKDKGFLLGGYDCSNTKRGEEAILIKYDKKGNFEWQKIFQGKEIRDILGTKDGGFILCIVDYLVSHGLPSTTWLMKFNEKGNIEWKEEFPKLYWFNNIIELKEGGFLASGWKGVQSKRTGEWNFDAVFVKFTGF